MTNLTLQQKRANLEILARRISQITGEEIEIRTNKLNHLENYDFYLPETAVYHLDMIKIYETILRTVKNPENGLLILNISGKTLIHTRTI